MGSGFDVKITTGAVTTVAQLTGEFDADSCSRLSQAFPDAPGHDVVLDLESLLFIDSSGVSEILRLRERVVEAGGNLTVGSYSPVVGRVLEITGLSVLLGIEPVDS